MTQLGHHDRAAHRRVHPRAGRRRREGRPSSSPPTITVVGDTVALREKLSWFETKPLFGWRVLVPRTKEQAGALSERLRSYGAVPEEVPTIAVEPPRTPQQMERAIKGLVTGRYEWVAFTSRNAVKAVRERFEEYGLDARAFAGIKVAAVGEQTAADLLAWGIKPDLVPSGEQSAAGLLEDWPPYDAVFDPIDRVFLPRADIATENLVAGLVERGWEVDDVTAYRTVRAAPPAAPIREAIKGGGYDAVLFTSSSTVRNLVGIAGKPHTVDGDRVHRPGDGEDGRGARPARRRPRGDTVGAGTRRGARGVRHGRARRRPRGRRARAAPVAEAHGCAPQGQVSRIGRRALPRRPATPAAPHGCAAQPGGADPAARRPTWCCRCSSRRGWPSRRRSRRCRRSSSTPATRCARRPSTPSRRASAA